MPLSQQRRNLSFLIQRGSANAEVVVGGLCCAWTKTGWLFGAWISGSATGCSFSFDTQDTREVSSVLSASTRKQGGGENALYKVWTCVPNVWFQQWPAGKFCQIISSVASGNCGELAAISPGAPAAGSSIPPFRLRFQATKVVICIWDCLIRSLY